MKRKSNEHKEFESWLHEYYSGYYDERLKICTDIEWYEDHEIQVIFDAYRAGKRAAKIKK